MSVHLQEEDVISVPNENRGYLDQSTYLTSELLAVLGERIGETGEWDVDGVECKVLKVSGGGWKKGRIKICLEFIPETTETSPLDDLREQVNQMS